MVLVLPTQVLVRRKRLAVTAEAVQLVTRLIHSTVRNPHVLRVLVEQGLSAVRQPYSRILAERGYALTFEAYLTSHQHIIRQDLLGLHMAVEAAGAQMVTAIHLGIYLAQHVHEWQLRLHRAHMISIDIPYCYC